MRTAGPRILWFLGLAALCWSAPLEAQGSAARLVVTLGSDPGTRGRRDPLVRTDSLLVNSPWLAALRRGLPVRLRYRIELWRSREAWLDQLIQQSEWNVVVRHEPLLDQFSWVLVQGRARTTRTLGTVGALEEVLRLPFQIPSLAPRAAGTYYYFADLEVTTLSDSDLDELQRIFRGELGDTTQGGTAVGRRARRLVLGLAGLPTLTLTARSSSFVVE